MKRAYSVYLALVIFVILFSIYFINVQINLSSPEITLLKAFNTSGAKIINAEVYFWGRMDDGKHNTPDELKALSAFTAGELGVSGERVSTSKAVDNDMLRQIDISGASEDGWMVNVGVQASKNGGNFSEKYISVSVIGSPSAIGAKEEEIKRMREKVGEVMKKIGVKPRVNICVTGNIDGKLDYDGMEGICRGMFREAGAKKVEGVRDGDFVSISAYSPAIGEFIRVEKNKVNLNLAIRYNSFENKTYIWLATPVITTEY